MIWKTSSIRALTQNLKINLSVLVVLSITSCSHGPVPKWDGEFWPGKPELGGVVRTESDGTVRVMLATEERFRKGAWISYTDLQKVFVIIQSCKQWKRGMPMMSAREAMRRFAPLMEDMQREAEQESIEESDMDKQELQELLDPNLQLDPEINKTVTE